MARTAKRSGAKRAAATSTAPRRTARTPVTRPTGAAVATYLRTLDEGRRADCATLDGWMAKAAGPGTMYGKAIVGYGTRLIRYADGSERPWLKLGLSSRKEALVLYGLLGAEGAEGLLAKLGPHSTGKGCLYLKRLADVDQQVLQRLIALAAGR